MYEFLLLYVVHYIKSDTSNITISIIFVEMKGTAQLFTALDHSLMMINRNVNLQLITFKIYL